MTSRQIEIVQSSFQMVHPVLEPAAVTFYERLFELDPSLRSMFRRPLEAQAGMLAQALTLVVRGIDRPDRIAGAVEALGRRHAGFGVRDEQYATVGEALLWTLQKGLGEAFTPEMHEAWSAAYSWLASCMQRAAATQAPPQALAQQRRAPAVA